MFRVPFSMLQGLDFAQKQLPTTFAFVKLGCVIIGCFPDCKHGTQKIFDLGINHLAKCSPKTTRWWKAVETTATVCSFTGMMVAARADLTNYI